MQQEHMRPSRHAGLNSEGLLKGTEIRVGTWLGEPVENGSHSRGGRVLRVQAMERTYFLGGFAGQAVLESPPGGCESRIKAASHCITAPRRPFSLRPETRNDSAHVVARNLKQTVGHRYQDAVGLNIYGQLGVTPSGEVDQIGADDRTHTEKPHEADSGDTPNRSNSIYEHPHFH